MSDAQAVLAYATALIAVSAVVGLLLQSRQRQRTQSDDFLWRLAQAWDSREMRSRRSVVATGFDRGSPSIADATALFNYLELVAYFVRSGTVDAVGAWTILGDFAIGYWVAGKEIVATQRDADDTVYADWNYLVDRFYEIEAKERRLNARDVRRTKFYYLVTRFITIESIERKLRAGTVRWSEEDKGRFLRNEIAMNAPIQPTAIGTPPRATQSTSPTAPPPRTGLA